MSSGPNLELTPGQRCLLDLLQRKLINTLQTYTRLRLQKPSDEIEAELVRLKEKIRRISARQKRFTLEIINGNGNNTIPKESFFAALGLVTKETLNKLNSKTKERRRRTTANPRFSHEAIQAKRAALEPTPRRIDSRVSASSGDKKPVRQQQAHQNSQQHQELKQHSNHHDQRQANKLLLQFQNLQREVAQKANQVNEKRESNRRLAKQNELIRKRGLDIISAINMIDPNHLTQQPEDANDNQSPSATANALAIQQQPSEPLDIWIDMKCDESLDELD